jgi:cytochrome c oxidase subunit 3
MSTEAVNIEENGPAWGGGRSPFNASYGKLMMWFFLLSDAFTFSALLLAYGALRFSAPAWPVADEVFKSAPFGIHDAPLVFVGIMTFILIFSSVTMVLAVEAGNRMDQKTVLRYMILTVIGGAAFLACQAWEWNHLFHEGANINNNPFPPFNSAFTSLFFTITGFHGFHVFSGVVINIIITIMVARGVFQRRGHYEMVEKVGLYWHFVDLVWVFVFTLFYLL